MECVERTSWRVGDDDDDDGGDGSGQHGDRCGAVLAAVGPPTKRPSLLVMLIGRERVTWPR